MKKIIPVLLAAATLAFSSLTVQADTKAEAMVNIETHETAFLINDVIKAGSVIQFNVGSGTAKGGYRFYPEPVDIGTSRIVKEHVNMTASEAISAPVTKNLEGRNLFSDNTRNMEVIQWRFAGFSDDNYAQFYGEWIRPEYKNRDTRKSNVKDSRSKHSTHSYSEWTVSKPSTKNFAGEQSHECTQWYCNNSETITLTYGTYMKNIINQITFAADNATISVEHPTWSSPSQEVRDALAKRPDVGLVMNGNVIAQPTAASATQAASPAEIFQQQFSNAVTALVDAYSKGNQDALNMAFTNLVNVWAQGQGCSIEDSIKYWSTYYEGVPMTYIY